MEFIHDKELNNLKLILRKKDEESSIYYVFEENFEFKTAQPIGPYVVGAIYIKHKQKVVNFHVNDNWGNETAPNYQGKGYGTSILHYIEESLLPSLEDKEEWGITIANCSDTYERFKAHTIKKENERIKKKSGLEEVQER